MRGTRPRALAANGGTAEIFKETLVTGGFLVCATNTSGVCIFSLKTLAWQSPSVTAYVLLFENLLNLLHTSSGIIINFDHSD